MRAPWRLRGGAQAAGAVTMLNAAPAAHVRDELLDVTDVLVVNEIEAAAVLRLTSIGDVAGMADDLLRARAPHRRGDDGRARRGRR